MLPTRFKLHDVFIGLLKSLVFAVIIVNVGCLEGFRTRGGPDAVGRSATSAVVWSTFLVTVHHFVWRFSRLTPKKLAWPTGFSPHFDSMAHWAISSWAGHAGLLLEAHGDPCHLVEAGF